MRIQKFLPAILSVHVYCAGFFLPAALMFAVTGGFYTFGIRGDYETKSLELALNIQTDPKLPEVIAAARSILTDSFQSDPPSGEPALKKAGTSWAFEWTGARADFMLEPTATPGLFKASYKKTGFHRFFVQLHKAKGGLPFKILAGGFALALLALFASGSAIALSRPRELRRFSYSLGAGSLAFLLALYLS